MTVGWRGASASSRAVQSVAGLGKATVEALLVMVVVVWEGEGRGAVVPRQRGG